MTTERAKYICTKCKERTSLRDIDWSRVDESRPPSDWLRSRCHNAPVSIPSEEGAQDA